MWINSQWLYLSLEQLGDPPGSGLGIHHSDRSAGSPHLRVGILACHWARMLGLDFVRLGDKMLLWVEYVQRRHTLSYFGVSSAQVLILRGDTLG